LSSCFAFRISIINVSKVFGEKLGIPLKLIIAFRQCITNFEVSMSWIRPTISPGYEDLRFPFFSARRHLDWRILNFFRRTYKVYVSKYQIRFLINANLSLCLGSIYES
jgi:hypothetical protein